MERKAAAMITPVGLLPDRAGRGCEHIDGQTNRDRLDIILAGGDQWPH